VDSVAARESVQSTIDALNAAWNRGDGTAFSAECTEDVDFINLLGLRVRGRAGVARLHETILKGPFAGSTLTFSIEDIRIVSDDAIVAIVPGEMDIPAGPVKGHLSTVATILFIKEAAGWRVASFHNTKRESTEPRHNQVMLETISQAASDHER
jgi:uncharacterized protein (TIGR02246 family)